MRDNDCNTTLDADTVKKNKKNRRVLILCSGAAVVLCSGMLLTMGRTIFASNGDTVIDFSDNEASVDYHDYVFAAKVDEELYTTPRFLLGQIMPTTYYSLTNCSYLKGSGNNNVVMAYTGDHDIFGNTVIVSEGITPPEVDEYYLILANAALDNGSTYEGGSYIVQISFQMVLLDTYDSNDDINNQSGETASIIASYSQYL